MVDADGPERQDSRSYQGSDAGDNVCHPSTCIRSARLYRVLRFRYTYGYLTAWRMGTRGQTPRPPFYSKCVGQKLPEIRSRRSALHLLSMGDKPHSLKILSL